MEIEYKYNEGDSLDAVKSYIDSTYGQHYVGNQGIQTMDVWDSLDMAAKMCQGTAIKYLMRFGRKEGYNRKDLLKAIHYVILLMHFAEKDARAKDTISPMPHEGVVGYPGVDLSKAQRPGGGTIV